MFQVTNGPFEGLDAVAEHPQRAIAVVAEPPAVATGLVIMIKAQLSVGLPAHVARSS